MCSSRASWYFASRYGRYDSSEPAACESHDTRIIRDIRFPPGLVVSRSAPVSVVSRSQLRRSFSSVRKREWLVHVAAGVTLGFGWCQELVERRANSIGDGSEGVEVEAPDAGDVP